MTHNNPEHKTGFIAFIGRPNSGKSTLLNTLSGQEISVVSPLPQTTWKNTKGILTADTYQLIIVDTPGIHGGKYTYNKSLFTQSTTMLTDNGIDVICYLVDLSRHSAAEEDRIAELVQRCKNQILIIFNKTDLCPAVEPAIDAFQKRYPALAQKKHIAITATAPQAKELFLSAIIPFIPTGPALYPEDEITDSSMRFFAAEAIRKYIIAHTREEVPHATFVEIIEYKEYETKHIIQAVIHVETQGQKGIIIGKRGALIRAIKKQAQTDLKNLTGVDVTVICHISVTPHWRDDKRFLSEFGLPTT